MSEAKSVKILKEYNEKQTPLVLLITMTTNTKDDPRSAFNSFYVIPKSKIPEEKWELVRTQNELEEEYFNSPHDDLTKEQEWHNCYTRSEKEENPRELAKRFRAANEALYEQFIAPYTAIATFLPYHYIAKYKLRLNIVDSVEMNLHFTESD